MFYVAGNKRGLSVLYRNTELESVKALVYNYAGYLIVDSYYISVPLAVLVNSKQASDVS